MRRVGSFRRDFGETLVASGIARWLAPEECREAESLLTSQWPWMGLHVAWHTIAESRQFDWGSKSDAEASAFVRELAISRYPEVALL